MIKTTFKYIPGNDVHDEYWEVYQNNDLVAWINHNDNNIGLTCKVINPWFSSKDKVLTFFETKQVSFVYYCP